MSRPNPYLRAWGRMRANQRQAGVWGGAAARSLPLLAIAAAGPLVKPIFLPFLEDPRYLAEGVAGVGLRLGMVLCGAMSIFTYSALVRGEDRPILDPHPADPPALLRYLLLRTAIERAGLPIAAALILLPMALHGEVAGWLFASAVAAGGWAVGLLGGFPVHLGSVWAAESPALAWILELIRGHNPRMQAALIYAPGVALALGGGAVYGASLGAQAVMSGQPAAALALLSPLVVGLGLWSFIGRLSPYHYRATVILSEVDGAWAAQEDPEEARRVYLEWATRWMPPSLRALLLRELRHGWRGLRTFITGAWALGVLAALPVWAEKAAGGARGVMLAGAAMLVVGAVAPRLAAEDPAWLESALPILPRRVVMARFFAVFGWLQGAIVPLVLALAIRAGWASALPAWGTVELFAVGCAALGAGLSPLRGRGLPLYLLLGLLAWAGLAMSQAGPSWPLS